MEVAASTSGCTRPPTAWSVWDPTSPSWCATASCPGRGDPARWVVVDGTADPVALTARILAAVHERLGDPPADANEPVSTAVTGTGRRVPVPAPDALCRGGRPGAGGGCLAERGPPARCTPTSSGERRGTAAWRPPTASPPPCCAPTGAAATCRTCAAALAGSDPDLHVIQRSGAMLRVDDAQRWSAWPSADRYRRPVRS